MKDRTPIPPSKKRFAAVLSAMFLSSCATDMPPKPRHVDAGEYLRLAAGSAYVGESEDHAFRKRSDGSVIYTDTADLPASEQAKVRSTGMTYSGPGSKVRWH